MSAGSSVVGLGAVLFGGLAMAGIVHIASILAMPYVAPGDAFARVAARAPLGVLTPLAPPSPTAENLPDRDPATVEGVCRYDLAGGPLRVGVEVAGDDYLSLAFVARHGSLFYAMTDKAASRGRIEVVLMTPAQLEAAEARDSDDEPVQDLRLTAPEREGFVHVRALAAEPSAMERARAAVASVRCATDPAR